MRLTPDVIDAITEWLDLDRRRIDELIDAFQKGEVFLAQLDVPGVEARELRAFVDQGLLHSYEPKRIG